MEIICLTVGDLATNCYLVTDEATSKTIIIDPGDEGDFISTTILEKNLQPQAIILTHGHYDHCLAALELKLNFNLPIYLHQDDLFLYKKAHKSHTFWTCPVKGRGTAKRWKGSIPQLPPIDHFLSDQEIISFGESSLQVLHTPGHTPGSICLLPLPCQGKGLGKGSSQRDLSLFTGDTLFVNGVGSTDHSYSSASDLQKSLSKIRQKCEIYNVKCKIFIYPGHEDYGLPLTAAIPDRELSTPLSAK